MTNKVHEADIQKIEALATEIKAADGDKRDALIKRYKKILSDLMLSGWDYALGSEREIDDAHLSTQYVNQRNRVIDDLQIQLGYCAERYRAAPENSQEDKEAIADYHKTFSELVRITGQIIGLDPDSELPDSVMPKEYVEFWV